MTRLQLPLKAHLRDPVDEGALQRIADNIEARARRSHRGRRWAIPLTATAAVGAAALTLALLQRAPGPLLLNDGSALVAVAAGSVPKDLALSDGSHIRLAPGARIEPLASSGEAFSAIVTRGRADFEVRPGGSRHWTIECGLATIEVVGTVFACERQPGRLRVVVSRGAVLVRGERVPDRARRLVAGQALEIVDDTPGSRPLVPSPPPTGPKAHAAATAEAPPPSATAHPAPLPRSASSPRRTSDRAVQSGLAPAARSNEAPNPRGLPASSDATTMERARLAPPPRAQESWNPGGVPRPSDGSEPAPTATRSLSPPAAGAWRELARRGRHREAFAVLGTDGLRQESKRIGVHDLLALADVARLSGHPAEAVAPLERILIEFAGDSQAPLAAFALGRLQLDSLGRPQAAAAAFAQALVLGIPSGLREDARARLVEAYARAGNVTAAQDAARAYTNEFPRGRHARAIEGWLRPR